MNRIIELQKKFLQLTPLQIVVILIFLGPFMAWVFQLGYSLVDENRLPYGLAFFQWALYEGDIFLAFTIAITSVYYRREGVTPSSLFFKYAFLFGLVLAALFILSEEMAGSHPDSLKVNPWRVYHVFYIIWVSSLLLGALRLIPLGVISGRNRGLALLGVFCYLVYVGTFVIDNLDANPVWYYLREKYPEEAAYVESHEI